MSTHPEQHPEQVRQFANALASYPQLAAHWDSKVRENLEEGMRIAKDRLEELLVEEGEEGTLHASFFPAHGGSYTPEQLEEWLLDIAVNPENYKPEEREYLRQQLSLNLHHDDFDAHMKDEQALQQKRATTILSVEDTELWQNRLARLIEHATDASHSIVHADRVEHLADHPLHPDKRDALIALHEQVRTGVDRLDVGMNEKVLAKKMAEKKEELGKLALETANHACEIIEEFVGKGSNGKWGSEGALNKRGVAATVYGLVEIVTAMPELCEDLGLPAEAQEQAKKLANFAKKAKEQARTAEEANRGNADYSPIDFTGSYRNRKKIGA